MTNNKYPRWQIEQLAGAEYNWDSFADLLTGLETNDIAGDLLYLYFLITEYHARNNDAIGNTEQFGGALCTLRELYRTFEDMGKKGEGTLKLTSKM